MLAFLGFVFSLIIGIKLTLFVVHLLLSKVGRNIGCFTKWIPYKCDYALIVGASGAIGQEYAREFASMGFNLLLIAKNNEKMKKLAQDLKANYQIKEVKLSWLTLQILNTFFVQIKVVAVDFSHPESVDAVKDALNRAGPIAALVNCMGI